jgi:hypothetical protein
MPSPGPPFRRNGTIQSLKLVREERDHLIRCNDHDRAIACVATCANTHVDRVRRGEFNLRKKTQITEGILPHHGSAAIERVDAG